MLPELRFGHIYWISLSLVKFLSEESLKKADVLCFYLIFQDIKCFVQNMPMLLLILH